MQKEDVKLSQQSTIHQLYNLFIAKYRDKVGRQTYYITKSLITHHSCWTKKLNGKKSDK